MFYPLIGSHGAGSAHETITPLIVWGKYIPQPMAANWHSQLLPITHNLSRHDVHQADLCPLIASLLGIPIPANSVVCFIFVKSTNMA